MATTTDAWDPALYDRFQRERTQPFHDLLALVEPCANMRVVDLGCGTGALTKHLHEKLAAADTLGLDASDNMLAKAAAYAGNGLRFAKGNLEHLPTGTAFDLVFSNAALHWIPDHQSLFARLAGMLAPGGQLAVQMPDMEMRPSHTTAARVAQEAPFREALGGFVQRYGTLEADEYAELLHRLGFTRQHVRVQIYGHLLPSRESVVEWCRGSLLTAYESRLSAEMFEQFIERYRQLLLEQLPDEQPFFFGFRRILMWGAKES